MSLARDLDMADGVLDGKLYGRPIVEVPRSVGYPPSYGSPSYRPEYRPATTYAPSRTAYPLDYPLDDGACYGRPVSRAAYAPATYRHSPLDAYDLAYAPRVSHASYPSTYRSPAVYDDGYYGAPYGSSYGYPSTYRSPAVYSDGYYGAAPARRYADEPAPRFKSKTANDLDAADGVIDGKYQGKDIVEVPSHASYPSTYRSPAVYDDGYYGAPYGSSYGYPSASYGRHIIDAPTTRVVRSGYDSYAGYPHSGAYGRRLLSSHAPPRTYSSYRGAALRFKSRTANDLDAADGVIDGKFQGKDIVEEGGRQYLDEAPPRLKSKTANDLDAADGVIDGKFQGKDIVEE